MPSSFRTLAKSAKKLSVDSFSGVNSSGYFEWVAPYLFYFGTFFDGQLVSIDNPQELRLLPVGAKELTVFQRKNAMKNKIYTHSLTVFYAKPEFFEDRSKVKNLQLKSR